MDKRIAAGAYVIIFIFAIFLLRLFYLQIIKGDEYKTIAESNRLRTIKVPAPRGIIYDRNNKPLVKNIPSYDVSLVREEMKDPEALEALCNILGLDPAAVKGRLDSAVNPFEPIKVKENISWEEVAKIEARRLDFPGVQIDVETGREYIYGSVASHVVGYLGRLTPKQAKSPDFSDVPKSAFIGQWGIEKIYDKYLRGVAGGRIIEVDAIGREVRAFGEKEPVKGNDIKLTIDIDLQVKAEELLKNKAGAVVALDTNTGDILVLASAPAFDPNLFARGIKYEDWEAVINDPKKPLLNRALQSQYPPGSTFKIITAIAGREQGILTDETKVVCRGGLYLGSHLFKCWRNKGHGVVAFKRAVVESCDVFFYEAGRKIGIDKIADYASAFGLGEPAGINLADEKSGIVPSTAWKYKIKKEQWYMGETLNTAIGQGYVSATPAQMARLISAVANNGKLYKLNLIKETGATPQVVREVHLKPETFEAVRNALAGVVAGPGGTGYMARSSIVNIAGKTGTAQVVSEKKGGKKPTGDYRDHAWFVAYAPAEDPQIAMSVFVEHGGHGGSASAPIAKAVIEEYYKKKVQGAEGQRGQVTNTE